MATPAQSLDEIMAYCQLKINQAKIVTEKFANDLLANADYHFGWADRAMIAAAVERVHSITFETAKMGLDAAHDPSVIIAKAKVEALQQSLRYIQHPERSTSVSTNAMSQFRGQAWAELFEHLSRY
jgi:hypothetical protein